MPTLDRLAELGFDWVWFLSVWQTGPAAQRSRAANPEWRSEFQETLPDLQRRGHRRFRVRHHRLHRASRSGRRCGAGPPARALHQRGLRLMLDFVPNHTGLDHPWVDEHPSITSMARTGSGSLAAELLPGANASTAILLLAYGRDPYFARLAGHPAAQLRQPGMQEAMIGELVKIAGQCDGVRCDMAMLVLPDVFERTWGIQTQPFWPQGHRARAASGSRLLLHGGSLLGSGMDAAAAGIRLHLRQTAVRPPPRGHARPVREHFHAGLDYQNKLARFLENHDEPRAAATFSPDMHEAAAVITFLSPGLRFFHQGQFEGRKKRISPHLVRGPEEPIDQRLEQFYDRLLAVLRQPVVRDGQWQLLECTPPGKATGPGIVSWPLPGRRRWRAAAGGGELCPQPEPVLRAAAVCGPWQRPVAAARLDR